MVILAQRSLLPYSGRPKKNDRVLDLFVLKVRERPQILREDAEGTGFRALQESLFAIGERPAERIDVRARLGALIVALRQTPILAFAPSGYPGLGATDW